MMNANEIKSLFASNRTAANCFAAAACMTEQGERLVASALNEQGRMLAAMARNNDADAIEHSRNVSAALHAMGIVSLS